MKSFLLGLAGTVLVVDALAVILGLLAVFGGAPADGAEILAGAIGSALLAGTLWTLIDIWKRLEDISQAVDDDICETLNGLRGSLAGPSTEAPKSVPPHKAV